MMKSASKPLSSASAPLIPNTRRSFLLKLKATSCPEGIGKPVAAGDWEDKAFTSSKSPRQSKDGRTLPADQARPPEPGDQLLIWINEGKEGGTKIEGGGTGLTALARVTRCDREGEELRIHVSGVVLLPEPRLDGKDLKIPRKTNSILGDIKRDRRSPLRFLDSSDQDEILAKARRKASVGGSQMVTRRASPQKQEAELDAMVNAAEREFEMSRGQGFQVSPEVRDAIEDYAMRSAREHYSAKGFDCEDVSSRASYDLRCKRGQKVLYVEVKGTSTDGQSVLLTPNEATFARANRLQMSLFILHSVAIADGTAGPKISGGKKRIIEPWKVDNGTLTAIGFKYSVVK